MGEAFRGPGGGQAGIKVKAYSGAADLPTRARNGDIAVITAVQISDVGCGLNVPEGAAEGMVWVLTGDLAPLEIPIGKPPIGFRPWLVKQYQGSGWTVLEAYVFNAPDWKPLDGIVFYNGWLEPKWGISTSYASGYPPAYASISGTVVSFSCSATGASYNSAYFYNKSPVSLASVNKICVLYSKSGTNEFRISVDGVKRFSKADAGTNLIAQASCAGLTNANSILIGLFSGYDYNGGAGGSATVFKVWFE